MRKENYISNTQILKYYAKIVQKYHDQNIYGVLNSVWKHMLQKTNILQSALQMLCVQRKKRIKKNYLYIILQDATTDIDLFTNLMEFTINSWKYSRLEGYESNAQLYNNLIKIALCAVKGDIQKLPIVFAKCDSNKLAKFIGLYFNWVLQQGRKCKFNSLTAKCLFKIHKQFNINIKKQMTVYAQYSAVKLARNLAIVLRNMIAFQYTQDFEIYKIAKITKNTQLQYQKQQKLLKWFNQYMYMRQQIPKYLLTQLRRQGITKIDKIKNFAQNFTKINRANFNLQYNGPQQQINPDLLLYRLDKNQQIYGLTYSQQQQMFYTQQRQQILLLLLDDVIWRISLQKYDSFTNADKYLVCLTAVITQKITKNQSKPMCQFINKLHNMSTVKLKYNSSVDRLFLISKKIKQAMKQIEEKNKVKEEIKVKQEQKCQKINVEVENAGQINEGQLKKVQKQQQKMIQNQESFVNKQFKQQIKLQLKKQQKIPKIDPQLIIMNEKKQQKRNKLSQKYSLKSKKYLQISKNHEQQQHEHELTCLICKKSKNDYSSLYYFASIKNNRRSPLYALYSNVKKQKQFIIDSCFHAVHSTCLGNAQKKCVLCSASYEMFIPVVKNSLDPDLNQFMLTSWWNQDFKKYASRVISNKNDQILFLVLFKPYIANLGIKTLIGDKRSKQNRYKLQEHLIFLTEIYRIQTNQTKESINYLLQKQMTQNILQSSSPLNKIQAILTRCLLFQINPNFTNSKQQQKAHLQSWLIKNLDTIKQQFIFKFFKQIIINIQWLLKISLSQYYKYFEDEPTIQQLWQHLNILYYIPQNLLQLRQKYQNQCSKCHKMIKHLCIVCNQAVCEGCVSIDLHVHQTGCITIGLEQGSARFTLYNSNQVTVKRLYFNVFMEGWQAEFKDQDPRDFRLNKVYLYQVLYKMFQN